MQGMALGTAVDSNVLSYPVLVFMKEQGVAVGRGGASPQALGETKPVLSRLVRRSLPSGVGRDEACPQPSGEVYLRRRARRGQPLGVGRGGTNLPLFGQEV